VRENVPSKGVPVIEAKSVINTEIGAKLAKLTSRMIKVVPFVSSEVIYLPADEEDKFVIAQANAPLEKNSQFKEERVEARFADRYLLESPEKSTIWMSHRSRLSASLHH